LHFGIAADIFRIYLLFHALPRIQFFRTVHCYMDCNDNLLTEIPDPKKLYELNGVAFNIIPIVAFAFSDYLPENDFKYCINNDVILISRLKQSLRRQLFHGYYQHLKYMDRKTQNFIEMYMKTLQNVKEIPRSILIMIIMCISHVSNIFLFKTNLREVTYLFNQQENQAVPISEVHACTDYLSYIRIENHGLSWLGYTDKEIDNKEDKYVEFWENLAIGILLQKSRLTMLNSDGRSC